MESLALAVKPTILPISVRAYAEEIKDSDKGAPQSGKAPRQPAAEGKERQVAGPTSWSLCFDTETTTDPSQRFRIGFYQLRDGTTLDEEGLVYDPDTLTARDVRVVFAYAKRRNLAAPMTLATFRTGVLIKRGFALGATIVTFNGPFDFSRIALDASPARAGAYRRKMRGGFSFKFSESTYSPRLQIKALNPRAALMELTAPSRQQASRSRRKAGDLGPVYRGHFVDVKTLASALTSRSHSLASLTESLGLSSQKRGSSEHGAALTFSYLDYARNDVQATWDCFATLKAKYESFRFKAPITSIISEASVGKAALETMGIKPWRQAQCGPLDKVLLGKIISTYYGGRTEVRIRREIVRVVHTDFTSMYPTVCTLQGLWRFVIAQGFVHDDATDLVRKLLASIEPDDLRDQATWRKLHALVRVKPDVDLFPVRAAYPGAKHATIGMNYLSCGQSLWFTLADCIAAKFLSGKTPEIEEAIAFRPGQRQLGLRPIRLLGGAPIDPYEKDLYRELICSREQMKAAKCGKSEGEKARIDERRQAYKITANSTSYGIFVQVNVNGEPGGVDMSIYGMGATPFTKRSTKLEEPGPWFHPLVGTLITGAARLMLALAERKVHDEGLGWAFCDTDSLAMAMPAGMDEAEFLRKTGRVVRWFEPLNPYGLNEPILKVEDVNFSREDSAAMQPLYCWAISSKRYALFNLDGAGEPIIRKASAHGLGHLLPPYGHGDGPADFPEPIKELASGKEKLLRWHHDAWLAMLRAAIRDEPDNVSFDYHKGLKQPTVSRYTANSPEFLAWFEAWNSGKPYSDRLKPYGFMYLLHMSARAVHPDDASDTLTMERREEVSPVAPFEVDLRAAIARAFDRQTGQPVDPSRLQTYAEALELYPWRSEAKFLNGEGFDRGLTERRHIQVDDILLIGKEADRWEEEYILAGGSGEMGITYGEAPPTVAARAKLVAAVAVLGKAAVARETGIARSTLAKLERGEPVTLSVPIQRVIRQTAELLQGRSTQGRLAVARREELRAVVEREGGIRPAARRLGVDAANLSKLLKRQPDPLG